MWLLIREAVLATLDGQLEHAVTVSEQLRTVGNETGSHVFGLQFAGWASRPALLHLGRGEEALAAAPEAFQLIDARTQPLAPLAEGAVCLAHLGRLSEARAALGKLRNRSQDMRRDGDGLGVQHLVQILEAAVLVQDRETSAIAAQRLARVSHLGVADWALTCVARHLGAAAALMGNWEAAKLHYTRALEVAERIRFRPEVALTHLGLGESLVGEVRDAGSEHPQRPNGTLADAMAHLDIAIAELEAMQMRPALARALALREQLVARHASGRSYPAGLSQREVEVLRLLAAGKRNRQIAAQLVISPNTVTRHVSYIFTKIGAANRAEAATYAARHNLLD